MTASLAAAQRVGAQIAFVVEARDEVERLLEADVAGLRGSGAVGQRKPEADTEDDDADTPIDGVPATTG